MGIRQPRRLGVMVGLLLAAGCGGIPEALVEVARDSAKEAIAKEVDSILSELVDGLLDEADLASLFPDGTPTE